MLPSCLLSLVLFAFDTPLITQFHLPSPGTGMSRTVDGAYCEVPGAYVAVWDRLNGSGTTQICFAARSPTGAPLGAATVLWTVPATREVSAGPVVMDLGGGRECLVSWAESDGATFVVQSRWLHSGDLPGSWTVVASHSRSLTSPAFSMDLGWGPRTYHPSATVDDAYLAYGDGKGNVWAWKWRLAFVPGSGYSLLANPPSWIDVDLNTFDGFPCMPRTLVPTVVWQHGSGNDADIVARVLSAEQASLPRFPVLADQGRAETQPSAVGEGVTMIVAATSRTSSTVEHTVAGFQYDLTSSTGWVPTGHQSTLFTSPASVVVSPPALGLTGSDLYFYAACVDLGPARQLFGYSFKGEYFDTCGGGVFEIPETYLATPHLTEARYSSAGNTLLLWAGKQSAYPKKETLGALLHGCD